MAFSCKASKKFQNQDNTDYALSLAETARRALPDSPNTADTLAWAYYQKGAFQSAIDLLQGALKASPNDPTFHYHTGWLISRSKTRRMLKSISRRRCRLTQNSLKRAKPAAPWPNSAGVNHELNTLAGALSTKGHPRPAKKVMPRLVCVSLSCSQPGPII